MMTFYKRSVHTFLGLTTAPPAEPLEDGGLPPCKCGLGLITSSANELHRGPNILESSLLKLLPRPPPPPSPQVTKKDPGGRFLDVVGWELDGFMSCTESLGFESCNERRTNDENHQVNDDQMSEFVMRNSRRNKKKKTVARERNKKFPPPLSSLNCKGQPSFFLRPVRKDGRLKLTQVIIHSSEIFRVSRQDGQLRLHLVITSIDNPVRPYNQESHEQEQEKREHQEKEQESEERQEIQEEEYQQQQEQEQEQEYQKPETPAEEYQELDNDDDGSVDDDGDDDVKEWRFRRCREFVMSSNHHDHHHHNLHLWSQPGVTTR